MKILAAIDDAGMSVKEQIGKLSGLTPVLDKALAIIGPGGDVAEIKEDLTSVQTGKQLHFRCRWNIFVRCPSAI